MFNGIEAWLRSGRKQTPEAPSPDLDTCLGRGCTFDGDISAVGNIRIDGALNGNVREGGRLILGDEGVVNGDVFVREAEVMGRVNGNLHVLGLLHIRGQARVNGDILAATFRLETDATVNGLLVVGREPNPSDLAVLKTGPDVETGPVYPAVRLASE